MHPVPLSLTAFIGVAMGVSAAFPTLQPLFSTIRDVESYGVFVERSEEITVAGIVREVDPRRNMIVLERHDSFEPSTSMYLRIALRDIPISMHSRDAASSHTTRSIGRDMEGSRMRVSLLPGEHALSAAAAGIVSP
jgi:hypothetical protein